MKARHLLTVATSLVAVVAIAPSARAADGLTISRGDVSAYPTVTLEVDAPAGSAVLAPGGVTVTENGVTVDATVTRLTDSGLEVMLVMDTSGSMAGVAMTQAKSAARQFLEGLPAEVRVGLVAFGDDVRVLTAPTDDRTAVATAIGGLNANGGTRLYDAVVKARDAFTPAARDRALVVLSDGGDTDSTSTLAEAAAVAATLQVEVVSLETTTTNALALARLAIDGRGKVASAADPAGLSAAYGTITQALLNRYRIVYTSAGSGTVEASVTSSLGTASISLTLPAAPAPPTTAALAPTTIASASAPTAAPIVPTTAAPVPAKPQTLPAPEDSQRWMLLGGGAACFVGLALLGAMAVPGKFTARQRRRQLGLVETAGGPVELSSVSERAVDVVDKVLRTNRRRHERIGDLLEAAGIALRPAEFVAMVAAGVTVGFLMGLLLGGLVIAFVVAALVVLGVFGVIDVKGQRRRTKFAEHLPDVLQLMVSSLRSGYGLPQAIDAVSQDAAEPIAGEFRRVTVESRLGRDIGDALQEVADRMQSPDFEMVVSAVRINRQVGGNLSEILANVAGTIRDRQRTARQVQALIGEGKISAYILTALPVLLALFIKVRNPEYFDLLLHGTGLILLVSSGVLLVVGWLWFQKLVRIKF